MIDKGWCEDGFIWNPSICEYECDKSCDFENCICRKRLIDKLVEECGEDINENEN